MTLSNLSTQLYQGGFVDPCFRHVGIGHNDCSLFPRHRARSKNQFAVLPDAAELRKYLDSVSCVEPDGKVRLSFEGMTLSFQCTGVYGSAQDAVDAAPLTGTPQGEYWYLTRRLNGCLRSLSGTATLGIAAGGMLLKDISRYLGRFREIFAHGKRNGYAYGRGEKYSLKLGNNLSWALTSEWARPSCTFQEFFAL